MDSTVELQVSDQESERLLHVLLVAIFSFDVEYILALTGYSARLSTFLKTSC